MKIFKNNNVYVTHGNGPFLNAKNALLSLDLTDLKGKSVLIKPNIGRMVKPEKGINTHPLAVGGVIEALKEAGVKKIAIGESPIIGVNVIDAFKESGITEIAKKYSCELIDMNSKDPVVKEIPNGRILESTRICADIFKYDYLLSLPVSKCHMHTGVTLSIKNMKGCLYKKEKVRYHQLEYKKGREFKEKTLDTAISDLASILLPDITVIDGFIGMQGLGPSGGEPVKSDFAVASLNPIGADIIGCLMMGINPQEINHLRLICERFNFPIDFNYYKIFPEDFKKFSTKYKNPPVEIAIEYPDVVLYDKESCSACLSTIMLFLKRFKSDMSQYLLDDKKLYFAIGKGINENNIKEGTVLIGNCTKKACKKGIFVSGCPPVCTQIYKTITGIEPEENEPN